MISISHTSEEHHYAHKLYFVSPWLHESALDLVLPKMEGLC